MDYSFNTEVARRYGVEEAVFIHNLYWWIRNNEANGRHYYEGRSWTYNSTKAFAALFPFWNERKIDRMIKKLVDCGALHVGNFNASGYDRTRWFALGESVAAIYQNGEMHSPKTENAYTENEECISRKQEIDFPFSVNRFTENGVTIPDSKPDINTDSCSGSSACAKKAPEPTQEDEQVSELAEHYQQNGGVARGDVLDSIRFYLRQGMMPEVIHTAIRKGGLANKRWPYIDGILRNWNSDGIRTAVQIDSTQRRDVPLNGAPPTVGTNNPFLRMLQEGTS